MQDTITIAGRTIVPGRILAYMMDTSPQLRDSIASLSTYEHHVLTETFPGMFGSLRLEYARFGNSEASLSVVYETNDQVVRSNPTVDSILPNGNFSESVDYAMPNAATAKAAHAELKRNEANGTFNDGITTLPFGDREGYPIAIVITDYHVHEASDGRHYLRCPM